MASFKDLMKAFLYEDVEEDDDELEVDEIGSKTLITPARTEVVTETKQETDYVTPAQSASIKDVLSAANASNMMPAANLEADAYAENQSSIFDGLDMEDISRPESQRPSQPARGYRYNRSMAAKPMRRNSSNDEYQAVISPIFGNVADDQKEFDAVHDAINLPKPEEGFDMTTIISPMFGNDMPEVMPVTSIPTYDKKPFKKKKAAPNKTKTSAITPEAGDVKDFLVKEEVTAPAKPETTAEPKQETLEQAGK